MIKSLFNRFFANHLKGLHFLSKNSKFTNMAFNKRVKIKTLLEQSPIGESVTIMGWVRTRRSNKNVSFIALNDGSIITNYQVVADP